MRAAAVLTAAMRNPTMAIAAALSLLEFAGRLTDSA
jgi:hypothetical protein